MRYTGKSKDFVVEVLGSSWGGVEKKDVLFCDCTELVGIQNCEDQKGVFDAVMKDKIKKYKSQTKCKVKAHERIETNCVVAMSGCMDTNRKFFIVNEEKSK